MIADDVFSGGNPLANPATLFLLQLVLILALCAVLTKALGVVGIPPVVAEKLAGLLVVLPLLIA